MASARGTYRRRNTKKDTFTTNKFRLYFFSRENRITSRSLRKVYRFSTEPENTDRQFAVFSDALRGDTAEKYVNFR